MRHRENSRRGVGLLPLLLGAALLAATPGSNAHPSHSSYAELEWSPRGTLDVALRVTPEDLERALSIRARRSTVLVDTPDVRALLAAYLQEHFRFAGAGRDGALELVGMELDYRETWIYFSLPGGEPRPQLLRNTLLMDVEATQVNRARRLWAPDAPVLVFTAKEPERDLRVSEDR